MDHNFCNNCTKLTEELKESEEKRRIMHNALEIAEDNLKKEKLKVQLAYDMIQGISSFFMQ